MAATIEPGTDGLGQLTPTQSPPVGKVPAGVVDAPAAAIDAGFGFQGGPIVRIPDVYVSFWGAAWNDAAHAARRTNLAQFMRDLLNSNYANILSQYGVGQGAGRCGTFHGSSTLTAPTGDLSDAAIHSYIQGMINAGTVPEPGAPSNMALILFMDEAIRVRDSGLGVTMCEPNGDTAFGYHYYFKTAAGHMFYYAVVPSLTDACLKNTCAKDSGCSLHLAATQEQRQTQVASHEFSELVSDPEISAWRDPGNGNENGDICNGQSGTITVSGRTWTVQRMYSKLDDAAGAAACILAPANPLPAQLKLPTGPTAQGDRMNPGELLNAGDFIQSADGRYRLIYQTDGNLVLYRGGTALWATGTNGQQLGVVAMQGDGNLVLYVPGGRPIWASNTNGNPGSHLILQNDGNAVIYRPDGHAIWATNTNIPTGPTAAGDHMNPGEVLNPGDAIHSADGRYRFIYQTDGNLVLYQGTAALWASGTNGRSVGVCIMQTDGNLVIYVPGGHPIWASNTNCNPGSHLIAQNDGNVVIYRPDGRAVWATNTNLPGGPTATGDHMNPGEVLHPGGAIASADGRFRFIYQTDGNLVLYRGAAALWASGTNGRGVGICIMQTDGNLVLYVPGGHPIWASNTNGNAGAHLIAQNDGNVVIYRPDGHASWATNTNLPTGPTASGDHMNAGEVMNPGDAIASADGRFRFTYQTDGNLVLYRGGTPLWASGTNGRGVGACIMQTDGNLVIYVPGGHPIWASNTNGNPGSHLIAQNDGNVVIYRPDGRAVWATNTNLPGGPPAGGDHMDPGQVLNPGAAINSSDGRFRFIYQTDGNLVLYRGGAPLWASGTNGRGLGVCIMQTDGNLVIYVPGGHAIWASGTNGNPNSRLIAQSDGNVVIYRPDGHPIWATNTVQ